MYGYDAPITTATANPQMIARADNSRTSGGFTTTGCTRFPMPVSCPLTMPRLIIGEPYSVKAVVVHACFGGGKWPQDGTKGATKKRGAPFLCCTFCAFLR